VKIAKANEGETMTTPAVHSDIVDDSPQTDQNTHIQLRLDASVGTVWQALIDPAGTAIWLGEGAVLGDKGQSYHCADGTAGVVRSFHPLEQLRLSWHSGSDQEPSLIEVDLSVEGLGTRLRLWHDGLPARERPQMLARWQERLEAFAEHMLEQA
jgi:uncharacterized protein YndB with AHSA1/START domain